MDHTTKVLLVLSALLCVTFANFITEPQNAVVTRGKDATFECSIVFDAKTDAIRWKRTITEGTEDTVYQSFPTDFVYDKNKFTIENPDPQTFNLVVKNVDEYDAGTYSCSRILDDKIKAQAHLVFIDQPVLQTVPTKINNGDVTRLGCEVNYAADKGAPPELIPSIRVKVGAVDVTNQGEQTVEPGELGKTTTRMTHVFNQTMTRDNHGENFTCSLSTQNPKVDVTNNKTLEIYFAVNGMPQITPADRSSFFVGEVITCTAEGYPEPTVKWIPQSSPGAREASGNLTITEQMVGENIWKCSATNSPRGEPVNIMKIITFTVLVPTEPAAGESTKLGNNCSKCCGQFKKKRMSKDRPHTLASREEEGEGGVLPNTECRERPSGSEATIAIGVAVPVVVIIIIVVVVCCVCNKRKSGGAKKKPAEGQEQQRQQNVIYRPVKPDEITTTNESAKPRAAPRRDGSAQQRAET